MTGDLGNGAVPEVRLDLYWCKSANGSALVFVELGSLRSDLKKKNEVACLVFSFANLGHGCTTSYAKRTSKGGHQQTVYMWTSKSIYSFKVLYFRPLLASNTR
jgi:hypothetical protein